MPVAEALAVLARGERGAPPARDATRSGALPLQRIPPTGPRRAGARAGAPAPQHHS